METTLLHNPFMIILFVPLFAGLVWYYLFSGRERESAYALSHESLLGGRVSFLARTYPLLALLRVAVLIFLVAALARPGTSTTKSSVKNSGIDIIIALDLSGSMRAEDFEPNRLEAARQVVKDFVARRNHDRVGMVVFSGDAYLQAPLTIEKDIIFDIVDELAFESVLEDGTAIGDALALAASRMIDSETASKIILLITDGVNNRGEFDPLTAARICAEQGMRVYTVGMGTEGPVPFPSGNPLMPRYMESHFDEPLLREIAHMTGGVFFRADSGHMLQTTLDHIDRLERSEYVVTRYHEFQDNFHIFLAAAAFLFMLEVLLRSLVYRKVP